MQRRRRAVIAAVAVIGGGLAAIGVVAGVDATRTTNSGAAGAAGPNMAMAAGQSSRITCAGPQLHTAAASATGLILTCDAKPAPATTTVPPPVTTVPATVPATIPPTLPPTTVAVPAPAPAGVAVPLGASIQAAVDANPPGTMFNLAAGTYRSQSVAPKSGDTFVGAPGGTILSGAHVLTGWTHAGATWSVGGQAANFPFYGPCVQVLCDQPEQLYSDTVLQTPVATAAEVKPGSWYFDHAAQTITVGADPGGHLLETSDTERAFEAIADNVTIKSLAVQMYATDNQNGTIQAGPRPGGWADGGNNWLLQDLVVRWNHGVGIAMGGGTVVRNVASDWNGNLGIVGTACVVICPAGTISGGGLVEGGEIVGNNTTGVQAGWGAGGGKWAGDYNNLIVRGVSVRDNQGAGLWADESDVNNQFLNNTVTGNRDAGIFVEISYGATIAGNTVTGNGLAGAGWLWNAGILVAGSSNVNIGGNAVSNNGNAIAGIEQNRGSGTLGPHLLTGLWVHDNAIGLDPGNTGIVEDNGDLTVYAGSNHFTNNHFTSTGSAFRYAWNAAWTDAAGWAAAGQS